MNNSICSLPFMFSSWSWSDTPPCSWTSSFMNESHLVHEPHSTVHERESFGSWTRTIRFMNQVYDDTTSSIIYSTGVPRILGTCADDPYQMSSIHRRALSRVDVAVLGNDLSSCHRVGHVRLSESLSRIYMCLTQTFVWLLRLLLFARSTRSRFTHSSRENSSITFSENVEHFFGTVLLHRHPL